MSRIFSGCIEAQEEITRDLFEMGTRVKSFSYQNKIIADDPLFETIELQGYSYSILNFDDMDKMVGLKEKWAMEEFYERVDSKYINPGKAYLKRKEVWDEFLVDGKFHYTYNQRIRAQLTPVMEELKKHPTTRQAIINIHNNIIDLGNLGGHGRVPCSIAYNFLIRGGKLDIYYIQRSCDFMTHWANDVWLGIQMLKYVASGINIPSGKFFHFITSLHAFKKDLDGKDIF